jgi:hypothetical protein
VEVTAAQLRHLQRLERPLRDNRPVHGPGISGRWLLLQPQLGFHQLLSTLQKRQQPLQLPRFQP